VHKAYKQLWKQQIVRFSIMSSLCFAIIGPRHRTDGTRQIPLAAEGGNQ
jgi:hypothetical protein